jgi:hypothetical protein
MKQQHVQKRQAPKVVDVVDNRPPKPQANDGASTPVRTVIYMEVNDLPRDRVLHLIRQVSSQYEGVSPGTHYILPIRNGKITGDVMFESEWLDVVNKTCEVVDGSIRLKNGATEVTVLRETV